MTLQLIRGGGGLVIIDYDLWCNLNEFTMG
jgi:hypothetical protein